MSALVVMLGLPLTLVALTVLLSRARLGVLRSAESRRKCAHVCMGLSASTLPLWTQQVWPVVVGAMLCTAWLALVRWVPSLRRRFCQAMDGVTRRSVGTLVFPAAVASLFALTVDAPAHFVAAMLVLSLADPAAALVGRHATWRYRAWGGTKSYLGSAAFALVAAVVVFAALASAGIALGNAALVALAVALVAAVVEGLVGYGLDNFAVPLASYWVLWIGVVS